MSTGDQTFYQQSWLHLMGALDDILAEARSNGADLQPTEPDIARLLDEAAHQHSVVETAFRDFMGQREQLSHLLDRLQRELAVAGVPLKGDII
jgi:hypothetical protein